jgi:TolB protein
MKFRIKTLLLLILTLFTSHLFAQYEVEVIREGTVIPIQVAAFEGASGKDAVKILSNDLERSGWFKVVESGGQYIVRGTAASTSIESYVSKSDSTLILSPKGSGNFRRAVHSVADEIIAKLTGKKGASQTRIAFISDKSGKKELYVMDYDGANIQRFTTDNSIVVSPNFSRQANKVAYTSYKSAYPDVYVMTYPSGNRLVAARYPGLNSGAAFSPDGSNIALTLSKDGNPELYTLTSSGSSPKRLTKTRGGESSPCWSPNGSEIVYSSDQSGRPQICVISSSGGSPRALTSSGYNTEPDWSAENGLIAYSSMRGSEFVICTLNPNGGGGSNLYSDGSCEHPSWSPDGRHLVFSRTSGGHSDLYILDIVTKEAVQLSKNFGNCTQPSWSGK